MRPLLASMALFVLLWVHPAFAVLKEVDLATPGDGLVTRDTDTGLDWLDLTQTTNLSYDDVVGGAGGWVADGWGYAGTAQVCDLFSKLGSVPSPCPGMLTATGNTISMHTNLLGVTASDANNVGLGGLYDDGTPGDGVIGTAIANFEIPANQTEIFVADDAIPTNLPSANAGSFLVRPAPPPPPMLAPSLSPSGIAGCLLLLGATGALALRRRS